MDTTKKSILSFLIIEAIIITVFSTLVILDGRGLSQNMLYAICLMFSPAITSIFVNLVYKKNLKGFGWKSCNIRYFLLAYLIPLLYIFIPYGFVLILGLIKLDQNAISKLGIVEIAQIFVVSPALLCVIVIGEEIGWRGFLLPSLCKIMSFSKASLITGTVWILAHFPIFIFSDYNAASTPLILQLVCFTILALGVNMAISWLRMKSRSLWPIVILHAAHNSLLQDINPLFMKSGISEYILSESGIALAISGLIVGAIFWFKRKDMTS